MSIPSDKLTDKSGVILRVIDEDITNHDAVGQSMLIPVKDFFVTSQKMSSFKLFLNAKEVGTISIEHQYVPKTAPAPPKVEEKKPEPAKVVEPSKAEEKKPEPPKVVVPPKIEEKKPEPPKVEPPKVLPPKVEEKKVEPPKVEAPKPGAFPNIS